MKNQKIVKVEFVDNDVSYGENPILDTYFLINPDKKKLAQLKRIIENRFNNEDTPESVVDDLWGFIYEFIKANFETLDIDEVYEIMY